VTIFIDHHAVTRVLDWGRCIDLLEEVSRHESQQETFVSAKFNSDFRNGSMRILFAADYVSGYGATKAYHTIDERGTRYLVSLIDIRSGSLLAIVDGRPITDFRTGAASGVIARRVAFDGPVSLGIVGSGRQARAQLECLATIYRIEHATVFSPTPANREAFAGDMSEKLGIRVVAASTAEGAVRGRNVVVAASKSRSPEPVVRAPWLSDCRLLCAVGNTRPQFAEIDARCLEDARLLIVDSPHAIEEAGELIEAAASGFLPAAKRATLATVAAGDIPLPASGMIIFKSVGTALQDLALAQHCYESLRGHAETRLMPDLHSSG
jgi:alanine dehydrogenase